MKKPLLPQSNLAKRLCDIFDSKWTPEPFSGCHLWLLSVNNMGYGRVRHQRREYLAHRFAWELRNGKIPYGMFLLHRCDTPLCVNPSHLFLGTQLDNLRDAVKKGRIRHGEKHRDSKLTEKDVREIREAPRFHRGFARKYGVSTSTISDVRNYKRWKHVK